MPRNVEVKARLDDDAALDAVEARLPGLGARGPWVLAQDDTFFVAARGRLKLRVEVADGAPAAARLIAYARADVAGPKASDYLLVETADPDGLREALARAHGVIGRVRKSRRLYLSGRTRVHLDRVEGLGPFVELEVVLRDGEAVADGEAEARALLQTLGVDDARLVATAYLDLAKPSPG